MNSINKIIQSYRTKKKGCSNFKDVKVFIHCKENKEDNEKLTKIDNGEENNIEEEDKESITKYGSFTNPIDGGFYDPNFFGIDFSFNIKNKEFDSLSIVPFYDPDEGYDIVLKKNNIKCIIPEIGYEDEEREFRSKKEVLKEIKRLAVILEKE